MTNICSICPKKTGIHSRPRLSISFFFCLLFWKLPRSVQVHNRHLLPSFEASFYFVLQSAFLPLLPPQCLLPFSSVGVSSSSMTRPSSPVALQLLLGATATERGPWPQFHSTMRPPSIFAFRRSHELIGGGGEDVTCWTLSTVAPVFQWRWSSK